MNNINSIDTYRDMLGTKILTARDMEHVIQHLRDYLGVKIGRYVEKLFNAEIENVENITIRRVNKLLSRIKVKRK